MPSTLSRLPLLPLLLLLLASPTTLQAFLLPTPSSSTARLSTTTTTTVMKATPQASENDKRRRPLSQANKLITSTATFLLTTTDMLSSSPFFSPFPAQAQAAELSSLPQEVQTKIETMRNSGDPLSYRDAVKALSETPGLDELSFDDPARRAVNLELKEQQRDRPDLWDAETSYYGGVVRRAVNPFHVIELVPLLKVGPVLGGVGYFLAILVQRKYPRFFALAYFGAVASLVVPAVYLILNT